MKVLMPIKINKTGGSSIFSSRLSAALNQRGHSVIHNWQSDYDILLVIARCNKRCLKLAHTNGKPIALRLDGAYYPASPAGIGWRIYNRGIKRVLLKSSLVIYQSEYAKKICDHFIGRHPDSATAKIYNGVDLDLFSPAGESVKLRDNPDQHILFTAQQFRRRDQIIPLLQTLAIYRRDYFANTKLFIAGDFVGRVSKLEKKLSKMSNVELLGAINNKDLPKYERGADVFLYCHPNPACPNNVIEAMACGLPIAGINDGAMREIVGDNEAGLLLEISGEGWYRRRRLNLTKYAQNIDTIMKSRNKYSQRARERAVALFNIDSMVARYLDQLDRLVR